MGLFDRIQSVDREKLLNQIDRQVEARGFDPFPILIQVNAGDDPAKSGVRVDEAAPLMEAALRTRGVRVEGLMTIAPLDDDPSIARRCFARMRELRDRLKDEFGSELSVLSMGMSQDLESAIAEGSTLIRVGSALFGRRPSAK